MTMKAAVKLVVKLATLSKPIQNTQRMHSPSLVSSTLVYPIL